MIPASSGAVIPTVRIAEDAAQNCVNELDDEPDCL